jgi:AcrR family transcriptional regulator
MASWPGELKMKKIKFKNAYSKKKDPDTVRQSLLDAAIGIVATKGIAELSLSQVSADAGVTKGALFHHFDGKETLILEMNKLVISELDSSIDQFMLEDSKSSGCFTRAYIKAMFSKDLKNRTSWAAALSLACATSIGNSKDVIWENWLSGRLKKHSKTDSKKELLIARLAADGIWLAFATGASEKDFIGIEEELIKMTRT